MADDYPGSVWSKIHQAADIIRGSKYGVVLTGAGISTPSGIPDFRSVGSGLWNQYNPFEVASLTAFRYNPESFYDWMRPLARQISFAEPNQAHLALAWLENAGLIRAVITQNIDGLHRKAGSKNIFEVHGSFETLTCIACYRRFANSQFLEPYIEFGKIPTCPECAHVLKPDIILFEEQLPARTWLAAQEACRTCDLMIVAGSSLEVLPVAGLPMRALENGAHLILMNNSETYLDVRADVVIYEDVAETLPLIVHEVMDG